MNVAVLFPAWAGSSAALGRHSPWAVTAAAERADSAAILLISSGSWWADKANHIRGAVAALSLTEHVLRMCSQGSNGVHDLLLGKLNVRTIGDKVVL